MDYADGGDLKTIIKNQNGRYFSEDQILNWMTQICLSLKHIHDRKILHRDLKSQNIFLKDGRIKLGDFGIAKCLNYTLDSAKTFIGSPYYLSPEIVQNMNYSFKSDIWSLGVLFYEICSLKMPFDAKNLPMLSLKIIRGEYNPLPFVYSNELNSLVTSLLSVDPEKRPNIKAILDNPLLKPRIKNYLNEEQFFKEFSHTVLHNYHPLKNQGKIRLSSKLAQSKDITENKEKEVQNPFQMEKNSSPNLNGNCVKDKIKKCI